MARRTGVSARTQALAKAAEAVARRDAERIAHEKAVQGALAEFFQAQAGRDHIYAEAEKAAALFDMVMRDAVRSLSRLGESRADITGLTDVPLARVREYLAEPPSPTAQASGGAAGTGVLDSALRVGG